MTNQQAAAKAKKRWGKNFYVRNRGPISSPEQRAEARTIVMESRAEIKRIDEEIASRLAALDWYQEFQRQKRVYRERISKTEGHAFHYRFSVGTSDGMFSHVAGQGDTWEEAFADADKREGKAAA